MQSRLLVVSVVAVLTTFQIVRNAVVQAEESVQLGSLLWRHHPDVLRADGMRGVGEAAAAGDMPTESTIAAFHRLATIAPLAPDPFLVHAALAVKQADSSRAERLLLHALRRNPRSTAGRFLLAELYLSSGRSAEGLVEFALLTRIMASSSVPLAGALEQFARSGGTAAQLRQVFAINPALENQVLNALARDPENADLIVGAATPQTAEDDAIPPQWQEKLLNAMVASGQYQQAYQLWLRLTGDSQRVSGGVFNPRYVTTFAPPPFSWSFTSSAAGVAEGENGILRVFHYGAKDVILAKQLLLLAPGAHQLRTSISGEIPAANQLIWTIKCLPSREQVLAAALPREGGMLDARFDIPRTSCDAQQLELQGRAQEPAKTANVRIAPIQLERAAQ